MTMRSRYCNESIKHVLGKEFAKHWLRMEGFSESEIREEYAISFKTGKRRIIDVVGISEYRKVAFEVGDLNGGSLEELYVHFDEVYRIQKIECNEFERLVELIEHLQWKIENLTEQVEELSSVCADQTKILEKFNYEHYYKHGTFLFEPVETHGGINVEYLGGYKFLKASGLITPEEEIEFQRISQSADIDLSGFHELFNDAA